MKHSQISTGLIALLFCCSPGVQAQFIAKMYFTVMGYDHGYARDTTGEIKIENRISRYML